MTVSRKKDSKDDLLDSQVDAGTEDNYFLCLVIISILANCKHSPLLCLTDFFIGCLISAQNKLLRFVEISTASTFGIFCM